MGGILSLCEIASKNRQHYHVRAMQVLAAFVRQESNRIQVNVNKYDITSQVTGNASLDNPALGEDAKEALTVIARRDRGQILFEEKEGFRLNLSNSYLARYSCDNSELFDIRFSNIDFGGADTSFSRLCNARFSGSRLVGAKLKFASLSGADLRDTELSHAELEGADLVNAKLGGANLRNANLNGAVLSGADFTNKRIFCRSGAATGLTQQQLDQATADPDDPPNLEGVRDVGTGMPVTWRK